MKENDGKKDDDNTKKDEKADERKDENKKKKTAQNANIIHVERPIKENIIHDAIENKPGIHLVSYSSV